MVNQRNIVLTTIDNPFSPFSQFKDWYAFDLQKGYDSCAYLERMAGKDTTLMDAEDEDKIILRAIDDIVNIDPTGVYVKVEKVDPKTNENGKDFKIISN